MNVGFVCQMSMDAQSVASKLRSSGLLRTQGLIGGKWTDAYDGKTIQVRLISSSCNSRPMGYTLRFCCI